MPKMRLVSNPGILPNWPKEPLQPLVGVPIEVDRLEAKKMEMTTSMVRGPHVEDGHLVLVSDIIEKLMQMGDFENVAFWKMSRIHTVKWPHDCLEPADP